MTLQATHAAKVDKLVAELPRIGANFLERFIKCLRESVEDEPGTSHGQIAAASQAISFLMHINKLNLASSVWHIPFIGPQEHD